MKRDFKKNKTFRNTFNIYTFIIIIFFNISFSFANQSCMSNTTYNYNLELSRGFYNWSIVTKSPQGFNFNSSKNNFRIIEKNHFKINKSIFSENHETFRTKINFENKINNTRDVKIFDFLDISLNAGSFIPNFDTNNNLVDSRFNGILYKWDLIVLENSQNEIEYVISRNDDFWRISRSYIVGIG